MRNLFIIGMLVMGAFMAGWFKINRDGENPTIEINRAEIRSDTRRAIDKGREVLDRQQRQQQEQFAGAPQNFGGQQGIGNQQGFSNQQGFGDQNFNSQAGGGNQAGFGNQPGFQGQQGFANPPQNFDNRSFGQPAGYRNPNSFGSPQNGNAPPNNFQRGTQTYSGPGF